MPCTLRSYDVIFRAHNLVHSEISYFKYAVRYLVGLPHCSGMNRIGQLRSASDPALLAVMQHSRQLHADTLAGLRVHCTMQVCLLAEQSIS